jgi:ABC-type Fe3+/spermidine/putrescine transport system ATPase subunit
MSDITLRDISKTYGEGAAAVHAVRGVSLTVSSGELFFLLGPSGCGKSTLLRMVAGLVEPTAGAVFFGSRDVTHLAVEDRKAAMVFQNYALWPHMTVAQNVEFGPRMRGAPRAERRAAVAENLARVDLAGMEKRRPSQLSGGQQQRVALARALAAGGDCVLLDEPLSNLDARLRLHMRGELRRLVKATGITAIYVTHDQAEALSMADRVAVMNDGQVVQVGTPQELYNRPASRFVADFLGEANFIEGEVAGESGGRVQVRTPLGTLVALSAGGGPGGLVVAQRTAVTCCVRPERLSLAVGGGEGIPATVETTTYLGSSSQYNCRLGNGATWKVTCVASSPLGPGAKVTLRADPADVILLSS